MLYQIVPTRYPSFVISADSADSAIERAGKRIHGFMKQENQTDETVWFDTIRPMTIMEFPGGGSIHALQVLMEDATVNSWVPIFETVFTLNLKGKE